MSPGDSASSLVIFHTADLHNRLRPEAARRLKELKESHPGCLLLDAGDAVGAGNLTFRPGGEPILRTMSEIGYHAMAMGNRESHPRRSFLERKLRDAAFPVLSANLVSKKAPVPDIVKPYVILESAGRRVAVIGLSPQMTSPGSLWSRVTDYVFEDPVEAASRLAAELSRQSDVVVCLSHCGLAIDRQLAAIPGVSLVLGGHSHRRIIEQGEGATIVHPGSHGRWVSRSEFRGRKLVAVELLPLGAD